MRSRNVALAVVVAGGIIVACSSRGGEDPTGRAADEVTVLRCRDKRPTFGANAQADYDAYFGPRRPKSDTDLAWHEATADERATLAKVRLPPPTYTGERLFDAMDLLPARRPGATGTNVSIFTALGAAGPIGQDAYFKLNTRSFLPGAFTDYGSIASAFRFQATRSDQSAELVGLALARCPDCVDAIVTLPGRPAADPMQAHDFFKIFEIELLTDRQVTATDPAQKDAPAQGKLYVSKPLKVAAVADVSGALATHSSTLFRPFQSTALGPEQLNYRGELSRYLYNLAQSGDPATKSARRTGTVGVFIRYAEANDKSPSEVCTSVTTADESVCDLTNFEKWRCAPTVAGDGSTRYYAQKCVAQAAVTGKWLTNTTNLTSADCTVCNQDKVASSCVRGSAGPGGPADAGSDAGRDAGPALDAGSDAGAVDGGDAGPKDSGADASPADGGGVDSGFTDVDSASPPGTGSTDPPPSDTSDPPPAGSDPAAEEPQPSSATKADADKGGCSAAPQMPGPSAWPLLGVALALAASRRRRRP